MRFSAALLDTIVAIEDRADVEIGAELEIAVFWTPEAVSVDGKRTDAELD